MASCSISGWGVGRSYTLSVTEQSYDPISNTSVVAWTLSASGDSGTWYDYYLYASVNGTAVYNKSGSWSAGVFPAATGSTSGTMTISHNADGTKAISFYIEGYAYQYSTKSSSGSLTLTTIDRTAPTVSISSPTNIETNSMDVTGSANVTCDQFAIRYKSTGDWSGWIYWSGSASSHTFTLTGLVMNTNYTIQIAGRKAYNSVWGYSGEVSAKTLGSSTITSASDLTLGNTCTVKWTPLDATFKYKLTFSLGTWSYTTDFIAPNQLTEYTYTGYTVPVTVANELPNSPTGSMTVSLTTYMSDGTQVGSPSVSTFTVTVPSSVVPTITSVTLAEGTHSGFNLYVKSLSTIKATTVASGNYNATITSIITKFGDLSYTANSQGVATSDILQVAGSMTVETTVTDSRGRTATNTQTVTVYDYFRPTIAIDIAINGTTVVTTVNGNIAPVNNTNAKSLVVTRKRLSDDTTTTHTVSPLANYAYTDVWTQTIADIGVESYEYTAVVTDTKQSVSIVKMTAVICISRLAGGRGVAFFAEASEEGFWIWNIRHDVTAVEYLDIARMLAEPYDSTADYYVGQFCTNNSKVWECKTAITGGETWTAAHWTELGSE